MRMTQFTRRQVLLSGSLIAVVPQLSTGEGTAVAVGYTQAQSATLDPHFPSHPRALTQEVVAASHGNVARVKELVAERPALARAAWDWGYGDWETALGAASHVGHREIAALLLANGAHPTIFSAAMLGQLEVVTAFITALPGIQKTRGPHGISLLNHAKAGGPGAAAVVTYLESLGDADPADANEPLDVANLTGTYVFGDGPNDRFLVTTPARGGLMMKREGMFDRGLRHHGHRVFNPVGAEAVRIRFEPATGRAASVTIEDGPLRVAARRA
jgi:hypothetical protein